MTTRDPKLPLVLNDHTHHHVIVFHPQYNAASNKTLFVAGDGGIYKTDDALAATATGTTAPCDPSKSAVQWSSLNNDYAAPTCRRLTQSKRFGQWRKGPGGES
jgi:hypothetical protein